MLKGDSALPYGLWYRCFLLLASLLVRTFHLICFSFEIEHVCTPIWIPIVAGIVSTGSKLVESASDLVPQSVPRPLAKGGVAIVGGLIIFGLVQKVGCGRLSVRLHACCGACVDVCLHARNHAFLDAAYR